MQLCVKTPCFSQCDLTQNAECVGVTQCPTHVWFQFSEWGRYVGYRREGWRMLIKVTMPWKCLSIWTNTIPSSSIVNVVNNTYTHTVLPFFYSHFLFNFMFVCQQVQVHWLSLTPKRTFHNNKQVLPATNFADITDPGAGWSQSLIIDYLKK